MMEFTGFSIYTREQYVEVSKSGRKIYLEYFSTLQKWLSERNPFTFTDGNLLSLYAGWTSITA